MSAAIPKQLSSNVLTLQFNEIALLQIAAGSSADPTVYICPMSDRTGSGGIALFSSTYFTTVASPDFSVHDVAE